MLGSAPLAFDKLDPCAEQALGWDGSRRSDAAGVSSAGPWTIVIGDSNAYLNRRRARTSGMRPGLLCK